MKAEKRESPNLDLKVWCDRCSIRIAPSEERAMVDPYDVAIAPNGKLYVANYDGNNVLKINPKTGGQSVVAHNLPEPSSTIGRPAYTN